MNNKKRALISLYFLLALPLGAKTLRPISKLFISVSPPEGSFLERFSNPQILIFEGIRKEILIWRGAYLELFSESGEPLRRVGRLGDGPGEYHLVTKAGHDQTRYFMLDLSNFLSILNNNFEFQKRLYLGGEKCSNIIYDIDIGADHIVAAQRCRWDLERGNPTRDHVVSIYNKEGIFLRSCLSQREGWNKYPDEGLLGGKVLIIGDSIYWAYSCLNKIWQINLQGQVLKETSIGLDWWHPIAFNKKAREKIIKNGGSLRRFYEDKWALGDMISDLSIQKNKILVQVLREVNEEARTYVFVLDQDLNYEAGPLSIEGYSLSGIGADHLYFTRYAGESSLNEPTKVEVLKCILAD